MSDPDPRFKCGKCDGLVDPRDLGSVMHHEHAGLPEPWGVEGRPVVEQPAADPTFCTHPDFAARVEVNRLEDVGRFTADVRINCAACNVPFRFIGLPAGLRHDSPAVSADAEELRCPIGPKPDVQSFVEGHAVSRRRAR